MNKTAQTYKKLQKGFTLIELLVVILIIGILAAGLLVLINPVQKANQASDATAKTQLDQVVTAINSYYATNNSTWPYLTSGSVVATEFAALTSTKELQTAPSAALLTDYTAGATPSIYVCYMLKNQSAGGTGAGTANEQYFEYNNVSGGTTNCTTNIGQGQTGTCTATATFSTNCPH